MTSAPAIDDRTATAIRDAMAAAAAGRTEEAVAIGERALADGGDPVALNALVGSLHCNAGQMDLGVRHLRVAHEGRPTDPVIALNLAGGLSALGEYRSALSVMTDDLIRSDKSMRLARMRGYAAQMVEDFAAATAFYEAVLKANPRDWETWNNLGNTRISAGDLAGGIAALRRAASLNPRAALTRRNLALALRDAGDLAEAENELRLMADDFPNDPIPLSYLFGLLQLQGWDADATTVLERALERDPQNIGMLIALGRQQLRTFAITEAQATFRRVLEIEPGNGDAFLGLADALKHLSPEGLPELVEEARNANIDPIRLSLAEALAARVAKRHRDGLDALEGVPAEFDPVRRWHLAGQLFDSVGEYDSAFDAFSRMNQAFAAEPTQPLARAADLRKQLEARRRRSTQEWRDSWITPPLLADRPAPVFLVGFPRSGTTLLDTMLMGHPQVEVMEERPVLAKIRSEVEDLDLIASMDEATVRRFQARYFELASNYAKLEAGSLLVDKAPLHMQSLPLIYRLFPNARFILALRHPADVVLSCFMTKFQLNSSMANFLQLDVAAEFYDLTFSMWEAARNLFPVEVHTVVYERLIEDPEGQLRPIVEALGLEWRPDMVDHQQAARSRGIITTASYEQVTEPLYLSAAGRWLNYRGYLEPVLPTLRPWIEKLGYSL